MGFTTEKISAAEDLERFHAYGLASPITGKLIPPSIWTVDRGRGLYFLELGGRGDEDRAEIPVYFALITPDGIARIEGWYRSRGNHWTDLEVWWRITAIQLPESMSKSVDEVPSWVKEALEAHGLSGLRGPAGHHRVHMQLCEPKLI